MFDKGILFTESNGDFIINLNRKKALQNHDAQHDATNLTTKNHFKIT